MVKPRALRVVFFGTPEFAVPTLDQLIASSHLVVGVVTQPDRPRGRGQKTTDAPVKARARAAGLPVLQPATLKDPAIVAQLSSLGAEVGVVAAYGKILPEAVLQVPPRGLINVHASILPRHRGAAPVHRAVIAGDRETGITIMRVVRALDAGPMLAVARRPIDREETSEAVERDLAQIGARLLVSTLDRMTEGNVPEIPQDDSAATYAARLTKEDGHVDWSLPAEQIHNLIRGLHPWPHAFTHLHGRRLILLESIAVDDPPRTMPGTVVTAHGGDLRVAAGHGTVQINQLQVEGKRPVSAREFLAGHPIATGDRLES